MSVFQDNIALINFVVSNIQDQPRELQAQLAAALHPLALECSALAKERGRMGAKIDADVIAECLLDDLKAHEIRHILEYCAKLKTYDL